MKFDAYEYIGVIVPGTIVLYVAAVLYPSSLPGVTTSLSLADLGVALVLAFVAGHLIQAGGNAWEDMIWFFTDGMPTSWAAKDKTTLLSADQLTRLDTCFARDFQCERSSLTDGRGPMRELFVRIRKHGKTERIDKFNRNYGLMRGIAVAFLAAAALILLKSPYLWREALSMLALCAVATYRMVRFGTHYAREVFVEYLSLDPNSDTKSPS